MKKHILLLASSLVGILAFGQPANVSSAATTSAATTVTLTDEQYVRALADFILSQPVDEYVSRADVKIYTAAKDIPEGVDVRYKTPFSEWHYSNGVINIAMLKAGDFLKESRFTQYAKSHVERGFRDGPIFQARFKGGRHVGYPFGQWFTFGELDDCGAMGASVIEIYNMDKKAEYMRYINDAAKHIMENQQRLEDGTLCRTFPNRMTVWADDLYMSVSFLARMGALSKDNKYFDDAVKQVKQITDYLWYEPMQLYYHCYYEDLKRTNRSHWGRANGWIAYAICQLLDCLPTSHPERATMINLLERQLLGASQYQNANGVWHQLLDKPDSYEEASITAIFTYCTAHAINEGWMDRRYSSIATNGWNGLKKIFITTDGQLRDVCPGTGTSNDLVFYYNRPRSMNEKHGMGLAIDCGIEMLKLQQRGR
jgi:Predicted unsaturated glucuronyl hydrolase involved in regulation of bacterial surface properties, and related proteins